MTPLAPEVVAELLLQAGLDPEAFDLAALSDDLAARSALNATLDELLAGWRTEPDTRFDPRWND